MSHIIAIAGGSGGLGRALVDALKSSDTYKPLVLARKANPVLGKEIGVPILQAEYSNPDSLVQLLEQHKIDTVISTITNYDNSQSPEENLITAAERSSVTHRYIPSVWSGFDYTTQQAKESPIAASRVALLDALRNSPLEWTAIFPGIFLDFYALSVRSHVKRRALGIDIDGNAAAIAGDGEYPVYFTHTADIANYTAALLGLERWEHKKYYLYGDTKTWNEVIAIAECAKGTKFKVAYDEIEKLKRGEITELPGHIQAYEVFGGLEAKGMFQTLMAGVSIYMAEGHMVYKGPLLNEMFPDIKSLTIEEVLPKKAAA
ncbi:hypothetical protein N0V90_009557 [Kalmusia sp. IMI 367209]|nr:hypothetical protein N0V90_009557 [Kalmusia sp. IMI 367209]